VRVAVIILALLAMILGPISGPAAAHGPHLGGIGSVAGAAAAADIDCDKAHGEVAAAWKAVHDHWGDAGGPCMDAGGCRHPGCMAGAAVPGPVVHAQLSTAAGVHFVAARRPEGLDVPPLLDPPRLRT
jgi:hypothetical protein